MRLALIALILSTYLVADDIHKYPTDNDRGSLMSFILLNYSRIIHEIDFGQGDYVQSILSQRQQLTLDKLKALSKEVPNSYQFAKQVADVQN